MEGEKLKGPGDTLAEKIGISSDRGPRPPFCRGIAAFSLFSLYYLRRVICAYGARRARIFGEIYCCVVHLLFSSSDHDVDSPQVDSGGVCLGWSLHQVYNIVSVIALLVSGYPIAFAAFIPRVLFFFFTS